MSDVTRVWPCKEHLSIIRMPEWDRVVQIATDCPYCITTEDLKEQE